jgi:peptidoglycan-associated lipoprotein
VLLCLSAAACSRRREPALPTPETTTTTVSEPATRTADVTPRADGADDARRRAEADRIRRVLEEMVFFDYDRADLRDDAQRTLNAKVAILKGQPALRLRIEGHADERGSVEYNLALSLRRANRVRDYLVDVGIVASRLDVAAFGEERPLVASGDESAWARNRRAEFVVVGNIISTAN